MAIAFGNDGIAQGNVSVKQVTINIGFNNADLSSVLSTIESETGYRFIYDAKDLKNELGFTVNAKRRTVADLLIELSKTYNLQFKQVNNSISIKKKSSDPLRKEAPIQILIDGIDISGKVISIEDNEGLPGVNVVVKGTSTGTITDLDGNYKISVPDEDAILVFSSVGFNSEEIVVGSRTSIDLSLVPDITQLEELVVIGYGAVKKSDLTGAVSSVTGEDLRGTVTASVDQALQGRVAGVQVTQNSGQPGGAVSIRVRGTTSLTNSSEPLYVIDGIQISGEASGITGFDWQGGAGGQQGAASNTLANLNPDDIESIEVLKDASATAIYGSRAANGVIIITTKRGKKGETKISYNGYFAIQDVYETFDLMDLPAYAEYNNEIAEEVSTIDSNIRFADPSILGPGTDWQEAIFQYAPMQSHTVSVSGGSDATQYMVSAGYFNQEGIIIGSKFDRYNLRANIDGRIKEGVKIGASIAISRKDETITLQDGGDGVISQAAQMPPHIPVKNFDGTYAGPEQQNSSAQIGSNPVGLALLRNNTVLTNRIMSNIYADFKIIEGLTFRSELAMDYNNSLNKAFQPTYEWGTLINSVSQLGQTSNQGLFWLWKNYLTYNKSFDNHDMTVMAGYESQKSEWEGFTAYKINLPNDIPVMNQGEVSNILNNGYKGWNSMASYFARVIYSYSDKYLFTGTVRRDGSSRFGPENRWGWFPSASVGWRISEEPFLSNSDFIYNLKLRAGWGMVGNQAIPNYAFGSSLTTLNSYFGTAVRNNAYSNPNVQWESTSSYNIGVDLSLFTGRVDLSAEVYLKETDNLLLQVNLPAIFGDQISGPQANVGSMTNKGVELTLNTVNIDANKFAWKTNLNLTFNRNEVTDIGGTPIFRNLYWYSGFQTATMTATGYPVGQFYGYVMDGIFTSKQEILDHAVQIPDDGDPNINKIERTTGVWLGDIKWKDLNGDGLINTDDQTVIGDPNPDLTYGFNNSFSYGPLALDVYIIGAVGGDILNYSRARNEQMIGNFDNQSVTVKNRARTRLIEGGSDINNIDHVELINPETNMPRFDNGGENFNHYMSTRWIEDGTYMRIQNVKLAYTFPSAWMEKARISRLQVYANIQNLLTITDYTGLDPQIGAFNQSSLRQNIDMGRYPTPRVYTFGLNLDF
jgi:TonB-linked SusC/RagA family outer membrane protein